MKTASIQLPAKLVDVFSPPLGSVQYRATYGGRGSGKSFSAALMAAVRGYAEPLRILCTRQFQASIKESFHAELKSAIAGIPWLAEHYDVGVDYLRGKNGTEFIFRGLHHNISSIKSLAKIDLTIVEEAEDIPEDSWLALEATVFRQPKSELWAIWNPRTQSSPVDKRFRKSPPANALIAEVNWFDNPYFPAGLDHLRRREQERLDPATYAHVWEGAYLENSDAQVFSGKIEVREFEPDKKWQGPYFGGDFGFSQDPTAAVELWIHDDNLYIHREAFKVGLELDDTVEFVCSKIPGFDREVSRWDCARPESISHIRRKGMPRAEAVTKWAGSVEDGIQFLRSFKRIVIHTRCENMRREARLYSYKVDRLTGDVTSKLVDVENHGWDACVEKGQLVTTINGDVPIEQICAGDYVLTRVGFRRVNATRKTSDSAKIYELKTLSGKTLRATDNHLIYTDKGFVRMDALRYNDSLLTIGDSLCERQPYTTDTNGTDTLTLKTDQIGFISSEQQPAGQSFYIGKFGRMLTGQYLKATTYIMLMKIAETMRLKTFSVSAQKSTHHITVHGMVESKSTWSTLIKSGRLQANGIEAKKGLNSIGFLVKSLGKTASLSLKTAINAAMSLMIYRSKTQPAFALTSANQLGEGQRGLMTFKRIASIAESYSQATNTEKQRIAADSVLSVVDTGQTNSVYDISVEGQPEFFASGVLVHNCRYALAPIITRHHINKPLPVKFSM